MCRGKVTSYIEGKHPTGREDVRVKPLRLRPRDWPWFQTKRNGPEGDLPGPVVTASRTTTSS
jgi:hypothetical protein